MMMTSTHSGQSPCAQQAICDQMGVVRSLRKEIAAEGMHVKVDDHGRILPLSTETRDRILDLRTKWHKAGDKLSVLIANSRG